MPAGPAARGTPGRLTSPPANGFRIAQPPALLTQQRRLDYNAVATQRARMPSSARWNRGARLRADEGIRAPVLNLGAESGRAAGDDVARHWDREVRNPACSPYGRSNGLRTPSPGFFMTWV